MVGGSLDAEKCIELLKDFEGLWEQETDDAERQQLVGLIFDRIAVEDGKIVEVRPRSENAPLFVERAGVYSGSDGTRTRDLRRDRPAL